MFLLLGQTVVPEVYVDLVEKVVRDVRDQPAVPSWISQIPNIVHGVPNPPPFATVRKSVPSTQQLPLRREVPIWDGDCGYPETCEVDEQERVDDNDSYASDGDEIHQPREVLSSPEDDVVDINSDSDLDGQDIADINTERRNQYTNTKGQNQWHYGTSRQTFDAIPSRWVLPFAEQYSISSNRTEGSTSKVGIFYKGKIFDTKQKLKNEFGNYALNEKFNPRIRRSTKNRFEASCNDIKCDFALRATSKDGCTYWVVKKFAHVHTCSLDTYESLPESSNCSTSRQFNLEMDEIKKIHQGTYDTLTSIGPEQWSRSQCPGRRYQMMTTNITKVLKNCIQKARRLPITAAMEFLRDMM
ncbi:hypothetical protein Ddye_023162 [Dipteronia dyeriana]|uniref:Transposase MuDR plant domain-containing protein n=1 Tax=Dipteronia dyeriana TaxID=168575 RepID=A0AAD9WRV7_9ROSI|nr:hypothetical protein Ddye_023162 [Dipteronia dyeriana]